MAKKSLKTNIIVAWQANLVLVLRDEYDLVFREYILVFCCFCLPCGLARPLIYFPKPSALGEGGHMSYCYNFE